MKLLEIIKTKVTASAEALWAWMLAKAKEWKLREKLNALWEKTKALWLGIGQKLRPRDRFMKTKA